MAKLECRIFHNEFFSAVARSDKKERKIQAVKTGLWFLYLDAHFRSSRPILGPGSPLGTIWSTGVHLVLLLLSGVRPQTFWWENLTPGGRSVYMSAEG